MSLILHNLIVNSNDFIISILILIDLFHIQILFILSILAFLQVLSDYSKTFIGKFEKMFLGFENEIVGIAAVYKLEVLLRVYFVIRLSQGLRCNCFFESFNLI